ncbi:hypothetical protein FRB91_005868, partial [Serendipita sp. 411]
MLKRPLGIFSSQRAKGRLLSDDFVDIHIEQLADHQALLDGAKQSKKRKISSEEVDVDDVDDVDDVAVAEQTHSSSQAIGIAHHRQQQQQQLETTKSTGLEDLEDIKDVFTSAVDAYEAEELEEAVELLRRVVHESNLLLKQYPDLTALFSDGSPDGRGRSPLSNGSDPIRTSDGPSIIQYLYGTSLLLLGRILEVYPDLAKDGEPTNTPAFYLAALDALEDGENASRSMIDAVFCKGDWKLAYNIGRTLVSLTDEKVRRLSQPAHTTTTLVNFQDELWPKESSFARAVSKRPPLIRRVTLPGSTPHEMLTSACDQFSRAMLHMPHYKRHRQYPGDRYTPSVDLEPPRTFSHPIYAPPTMPGLGIKSRTLVQTVRPRVLFTIASEVLSIADRMPAASERQDWAKWADDVFLQMDMEANMATGTPTTPSSMEDWRLPIATGRGRCWLIIGASKFETIEAELEEGGNDVLNSEKVEDVRAALLKAIDFLTKAQAPELTGPTSIQDPFGTDFAPLLGEAFVTLAALAPEGPIKDQFLARASALGIDVD